jgi:hypothetical protein
MKKHYAITDDDRLLYLGEHENFFGADDAAQETGHNIVWIFDADIMREWFAEIKAQTPEELA